MAIFENENITTQIEKNPMAYFNIFPENGRLDPPLTVALDALRQCTPTE